MATTAELVDYSNRILTAAQMGTPTNPNGVPPPVAALMLAMAKHESGNFTSRGFREGNNAFGYSFVKDGKWQETQPGSYADNGAPLAKYQSVENSAREVVDWIYRRVAGGTFPALSTVTDPTQFALALVNDPSHKYYTDTVANYANGLKRWYVPLQPSGGKAAGTGGVVLLLALVAAVGFIATRNKKKPKTA